MWGADLIKELIFLSICTWKNLEQQKVLASIGGQASNASILSSVSSNLEAGKRRSFYQKTGQRKEAKFSLSADFRKSSQIKQMRFIPNEQAIEIVRKRAEKLKFSRINSTP